MKPYTHNHKVNARVYFLGAEWIVSAIENNRTLLRSRCHRFNTTVSPKYYRGLHEAPASVKPRQQYTYDDED